MTANGSLFAVTGIPYLDILILVMLFSVALYLAREPFHRAIRSLSRVVHSGMRLAARSVKISEVRLVERNRDVLIAEGKENAERIIEREFERLSNAVDRDLQKYPKLHRQLADTVTRLEDNYSASAEIQPELPAWMPVIESISRIDHKGDAMVANILEEIHKTLEDQHKAAIDNYRSDCTNRHRILHRMMPFWRLVIKKLDKVGASVKRLSSRAASVDRYIQDYEEIRSQTDKATRRLSSSSLTQFFISGLVLMIAFGGALVNFNLIALPMSEMVGGASYIGSFKTSDVAGLVIILVELTMGLFLMESLRITRLFPIIHSMDDRMRFWMIWITLTLLATLAGVESALAFMRDRIAHDMEMLRQTLSGVDASSLPSSMIPTIGQMVMGFILPFALAFVAIPLESFISSSRTVLGICGAWGLRTTAFCLRLAGNVALYGGKFVRDLYDVFIFPGLWLETILRRNPSGAKAEPPTTKQKAPNANLQEATEKGVCAGCAF
jgi:hypothetical protein